MLARCQQIDSARIHPTSPVLDFAVMNRVGPGALASELVLEPAWRAAIEETLGQRFGDPSPQPSRATTP